MSEKYFYILNVSAGDGKGDDFLDSRSQSMNICELVNQKRVWAEEFNRRANIDVDWALIESSLKLLWT